MLKPGCMDTKGSHPKTYTIPSPGKGGWVFCSSQRRLKDKVQRCNVAVHLLLKMGNQRVPPYRPSQGEMQGQAEQELLRVQGLRSGMAESQEWHNPSQFVLSPWIPGSGHRASFGSDTHRSFTSVCCCSGCIIIAREFPLLVLLKQRGIKSCQTQWELSLDSFSGLLHQKYAQQLEGIYLPFCRHQTESQGTCMTPCIHCSTTPKLSFLTWKCSFKDCIVRFWI